MALRDANPAQFSPGGAPRPGTESSDNEGPVAPFSFSERSVDARLRVNEIFYSVQGESTHAGRPCIFVRLTGCPLRCHYCDTEYAFHAGEWRTVADILAAVGAYPCRLVEVTGGEPLAQPHAIDLLQALVDRDYEVLLETSGALPIENVPAGVRRIVDLKTPDSGEVERNRWENLRHLRPGDEVKFVIASRADYEWSRGVIHEHRLGAHVPVLLSPVWESGIQRDLAAWLLADGMPARLQIQLHKWIWPEASPGV